MNYRKLSLHIGVALLCTSLTAGVHAERLNPHAHINTAISKIEANEFSLARAYLAPALIAPNLTAPERSRAYYLRGFSYHSQNLFVSALRDYQRALEFHPDNAIAQATLATLYYFGEGNIKPQPQLALQLFTSAAAQDNTAALFHLGHAHLTGTGTPVDIDMARQWLERAANAESVPAMEYLGRSYRAGQTDNPNPQLAKQWLERAIAAGSEDARVALAYMLSDGELGKPDPNAAAQMLTKAAQAGSGKAQVALSHFYLSGTGVKKDPVKSRELLEQAVQQGPAQTAAQAHLRLGFLYESGQGVKPDRDAAQAAYTRAAQAGLIDAQQRLALMLLKGNSVDDYLAGKRWLQRAADSNSPGSMNDFAWVLSTSKHEQVRDGVSALKYAQRAVAQERNSAYLDTLAAAYAELGQFEDAITAQQQALAVEAEHYSKLVSAKASDAQIAATKASEQELKSHLEAYIAQQPWRE